MSNAPPAQLRSYFPDQPHLTAIQALPVAFAFQARRLAMIGGQLSQDMSTNLRQVVSESAGKASKIEDSLIRRASYLWQSAHEENSEHGDSGQEDEFENAAEAPDARHRRQRGHVVSSANAATVTQPRTSAPPRARARRLIAYQVTASPTGTPALPIM